MRIRAVLVLLGARSSASRWRDYFTTWAEDEMYADPIVFTETTPYQRIVVTRGRAGFQLFLNGNLQFSSADEYRYHEALVHPAMVGGRCAAEAGPRSSAAATASRCARCSRIPRSRQVTLVDLDPAMTDAREAVPAARRAQPPLVRAIRASP